MDRRSLLHGSCALAGASLLGGCARRVVGHVPVAAALPGTDALPFYDMPGTIIPIRADVDRIFRITVCLRPFRAAGPRFDVVKVNNKTIVMNYGHGGSGWSLSWGSADYAVRKAMEACPGEREIAIIGAGALGLTAALTAQRMGFNVTIYAKERPPYVRSARATGSWTPDSRVALANVAAPTFASLWEGMARTSFSMYQSYLGTAGSPIEWTDRYSLYEDSPVTGGAPPAPSTQEVHDFARYRERISDLTPRSQLMPAGSTPFPTKYVRRSSSLTFNVASYSRQLMQELQIAGGRIETREFQTPADIMSLPQQVVLCCTGYGSRALWSDESIVPVRGQIAWLIPQDGVTYGLNYKGLNVLARRDGIVIQPAGDHGEEEGWNDTNEEPNRAEAEAGVKTLQELYARMAPHLAKRETPVRA